MVICGDPAQTDRKANWTSAKAGIEQYAEMIDLHQANGGNFKAEEYEAFRVVRLGQEDIRRSKAAAMSEEFCEKLDEGDATAARGRHEPRGGARLGASALREIGAAAGSALRDIGAASASALREIGGVAL